MKLVKTLALRSQLVGRGDESASQHATVHYLPTQGKKLPPPSPHHYAAGVGKERQSNPEPIPASLPA